MKYLIVNADDFGLNSGITRAILDAHRLGIVTSATIMANMPGFEEAIRLVRNEPELGVGLHFNLTQGRPLSDPASIPGLVDREGMFLGSSTALAGRMVAGRLREEEIVAELRAQIERVLDTGLALTHLDSHKHAHVLPMVFRAVCRTAAAYGLRALRLPHERGARMGVLSGKLVKQRLVAAGLAGLSRLNRPVLRSFGLAAPDRFLGLTQTGFWNRDWLIDLFQQLPHGISELMCHPGYLDEDWGVAKTRLRESRLAEFHLLTDPEVIATIERGGIRLISYRHF